MVVGVCIRLGVVARIVCLLGEVVLAVAMEVVFEVVVGMFE